MTANSTLDAWKSKPYYWQQIERQRGPSSGPVPLIVAAEHQPPITEKDLQAQAEALLTRHGYRRLTEPNILRCDASEVNGWFAHWHGDIRDQPVMPDLIVFNATMSRCLCVELKAGPKAKIRKAQKVMITRRAWRIAFSLDEFAGIVAAWRAEE